jgi:CRP-like cAMP-binding protein
MFFRRRSDKIEILKTIPLFSGLNQRELGQIAQQADEIPVEAGKVLAREGEYGREFILLVDGRARVERNGKVIGHLARGDFLGEISLIDKEPRLATVVTETPAQLLVLHKRSFDQILDTVPGLPRKFMLALCKYIRRAEARAS